MKIIAGLGNPTDRYAGTRHNVGFSAILEIADHYDISIDTKKHKALIGKGMIGSEKVILAMPQTYMNLSGESIVELLNYYKCDNTDLLVIYDDIDLDVGKLRIRTKGSAGGHNGIKNIIAHIGTQEFDRIRIGVGHKPKGWDLADYVLGRFQSDEQVLIREGVRNAREAAACILDSGADVAMNRFN